MRLAMLWCTAWLLALSACSGDDAGGDGTPSDGVSDASGSAGGGAPGDGDATQAGDGDGDGSGDGDDDPAGTGGDGNGGSGDGDAPPDLSLPTLSVIADGMETPIAFTNALCSVPEGPFGAGAAFAFAELSLRLDNVLPTGASTDPLSALLQAELPLTGSGSTHSGVATVQQLYYGTDRYWRDGSAALQLSYEVRDVPDLGAEPYDLEFVARGELSLASAVTLTPIEDADNPVIEVPAQALPFACLVTRPRLQMTTQPSDGTGPLQMDGCDWSPQSDNRCPVCEGTPVCDTPSYTDLGDGTVASSCCDLVWQQDSDDEVRGWEEADAYCEALPLAGGGWRLPSVTEAESLVVLGQTPVEPTLDRVAFPDQPTGWYWTSSASDSPGWAWAMHFFVGMPITWGLTTEGSVRCVR